MVQSEIMGRQNPLQCTPLHEVPEIPVVLPPSSPLDNVHKSAGRFGQKTPRDHEIRYNEQARFPDNPQCFAQYSATGVFLLFMKGEGDHRTVKGAIAKVQPGCVLPEEMNATPGFSFRHLDHAGGKIDACHLKAQAAQHPALFTRSAADIQNVFELSGGCKTAYLSSNGQDERPEEKIIVGGKL